MPTHTLLSGELLEYEQPTSELAAFVDELRAMVDRPTVTVDSFIGRMYAADNPLLDPTIIPGRGTVTKAVFANPLYHVMQDLLDRKRVALGSLDMAKVRERYSMTVREAAAKVGVHENAIRLAIKEHRLASVKDKGEHRLDPEEVARYKPRSSGPPAGLEVVFGSAPGERLSIKHDGEIKIASREAGIQRGHLARWNEAAVLASAGEKARFWRIEPGGDAAQEIRSGSFAVRGRFKVVDKSNNARTARELFKAIPRSEGDGGAAVEQAKR